MKDFREMDELVFEFSKDTKHFAQNYGGTMPPAIKAQLQDLMYTWFGKEIDAISEFEQIEIKYKKKFYNKLLKAKMKLANLDRADAWFDKIFQKYFNRGILEHLIVYAVKFLYKKDLFVAKRLFTQIDNDELLSQFTLAACEYLGWTGQNEPVEQPTTEETSEDVEVQEETDETDENSITTPDEQPQTAVTVYEPQELQPAEQQQQPVVKVERTVTHEVMTATPGTTMPDAGIDVAAATDNAQPPASSLNSEEKQRPSFYQPGGKSKKT